MIVALNPLLFYCYAQYFFVDLSIQNNMLFFAPSIYQSSLPNCSAKGRIFYNSVGSVCLTSFLIHSHLLIEFQFALLDDANFGQVTDDEPLVPQ